MPGLASAKQIETGGTELVDSPDSVPAWETPELTERLSYELRFNAFSPATIPMSRLAEYMADLAKILGEHTSVHFAALNAGSTVVQAVIDKEAIPKVVERINSWKIGKPPADLASAYKALDRRLFDDNAVGILTAFADDALGAEIIRFPGCERPKAIDYGNIRERGSVEGIPVSIVGRDATKHLQLSDGGKRYTGIYMSEALAIKIVDAKCLFRKVIRVQGTGRWQRDEDEQWQLLDFKAEDFEILDDSTLGDAIRRLRAIRGSEWTETEDPIRELQQLRGDDDRPH